jgi:hypothetical protein
MICPECRSAKMTVVKTMVLAGATKRLVECPCGIRCETEETVIRRLPAAQPPGNAQVTASQPPGNPPATKAGAISGSDSSLPPEPLSNPDQTQTPARVKKPAEPNYTAAFEAVWAGCDRRGVKFPAFKAWEKCGKPPAEQVVAVWKAYLASLEEWRSPQDVSTWLNARGHTQEWTSAKKPPKESRCGFHRAFGARGKRPPAGWFADCPECRHARAAAGTRQSDASPVVDLVAATEAKLAKDRNVRLPTPEELAELRSARGAP